MIADLSPAPSTPCAPDPEGDLATYAVDYESYYDKECSIKPLGYWAYCRHPLFEAYTVSIYGPGVSFVGPPSQAPWDKIRGAGFRWLSHNAAFDEEVHAYLIEIGAIPADATPEVWECTADLVGYLGSPRALAKCLQWLCNINISKAVRDEMKGQRWENMTEEFRARVTAYALDDSIHCRNLWIQFSAQWPAHERALSRLNRKAGRRGLRVDVPLLDSDIQKLQAVTEEARAMIPWAPNDPDEEKGILSKKGLKLYCTSVGILPPMSLAKDSPECEEWLETYGDQYPVVAAMGRYRRANALLKKAEKMRRRVKPDGRMPYSLKYFGAPTTGRWSGDMGWNPQNQHGKEIFGVNPRMWIIPAPGHTFILADSSQIEPRCLAWLAGNWEFIAKVVEGFGIYEAYAVAKGKWPAEKKGRLKKEDPALYKWAKAAVLGLGYGCGATKFVLVAKIMADLVIEMDESQAMVSDFRATETFTTGLWRRLESAMKCHVGRDFHMQLPTGRILRYRNVEVEDGGITAEICKNVHGVEKILRMRYWGGVLTENLVQATAREVFASIMLRLEAAGIDVAFHVHDEVICEVPIDQAEELEKKVVAIMSATPKFIKGCPLGCESQIAGYYQK